MSSVIQFKVGPMENFVYLIPDHQSKEAFVVDPGWESQKIEEELKKAGLKLKAILCTHHHYDHINEIEVLLKNHDVPVYMSKVEADHYGFQCENLQKLDPGEEIEIGNKKVQALHTPGHTTGSTTFKFENCLITGDTLFVNGCGRCDLEGGDAQTMYDTLGNLANLFPKETLIYPGHDYADNPESNLESEIQNNPYFQFKDVQDFVRYRM